jgi:hypothetical protein
MLKPEYHFVNKVKQSYIPLIWRDNLDYDSVSALL